MGTIGNFYVLLMVVILFLGTGVIGLNLAQNSWRKAEGFIDKKGGRIMNKWLRLAIISFAGMILTTFALGLVNTFAGQGDHSAHSGAGATHGAVTGDNQLPGQHAVPVATVPGQTGQQSIEAQIYYMQMNIMQMQQQVNQLTRMFQLMNYQGMPGSNPGGMNNTSSGTMNGMGSMGGMSMM